MRDVYQQVIVTCTTINVMIFLTSVISWIGIKISDHKDKKRREREDKERAKNMATEQ